MKQELEKIFQKMENAEEQRLRREEPKTSRSHDEKGCYCYI